MAGAAPGCARCSSAKVLSRTIPDGRRHESEEAVEEPDERARALHMGALAAKILARLATSELLENDTQQQAALLAVRLVDSLQLRCSSLAPS